MFFDTCSYGQDVDVEDDIFRIDSCFFSQELICSFAYLDLPVECYGLTVFVEGHHHHCGTERPYSLCFLYKSIWTFLQADGIDNAFALGIF